MRTSHHLFTLRQLQYVVVLAEHLSFRRAAEHCHVSQPSLSAQIAQIEQMLDFEIFERDRKHVLMTPAGTAFVEQARKLLLDTDDLEDFAKQLTDPFSGPIHIGIIPTMAPYLLPIIAPHLAQTFPKLHFQWSEDKTEILIKEIQDGSLDGALMALESQSHQLQTTIIGKDPFYLAAASNHPLVQNNDPAPISLLNNQNILVLGQGHCLGDQAAEFCNTANAIHHQFRATSLNTMIQMVAHGDAITLLPQMALQNGLQNADLAVRPFKDDGPKRTIVMVTRHGCAMWKSIERINHEITELYRSTSWL